MPAGTSKANQRQSSKRQRNNKKWGLTKVRHKVIPIICPACSKTREVPSQEMYQKGGISCGCKRGETILTKTTEGLTIEVPASLAKFRFDLHRMPKHQIISAKK